MRRLPWAIPLLALAFLALAAPKPPEPSIALVIDYNDGVQKSFNPLPWSPDMTVLDAMNLAANHPRGIAFDLKGSGPTAFLTRIDNLPNQGASGKNWIYTINGSLADKSFGVQRLNPADTVQWKFAGKEDYPK